MCSNVKQLHTLKVVAAAYITMHISACVYVVSYLAAHNKHTQYRHTTSRTRCFIIYLRLFIYLAISIYVFIHRGSPLMYPSSIDTHCDRVIV